MRRMCGMGTFRRFTSGRRGVGWRRVGRHLPRGSRIGPGYGLVSRGGQKGLRRTCAEGARPVRRVRRHPARGDAAGLRGHGHRHQPPGMVHHTASGNSRCSLFTFMSGCYVVALILGSVPSENDSHARRRPQHKALNNQPGNIYLCTYRVSEHGNYRAQENQSVAHWSRASLTARF